MYVFVYAGGAIAWSTRVQEVIVLSCVEAEYIALSSATRQATWMRTRLLELGVMDKDESVRIWEDNQGAISLA